MMTVLTAPEIDPAAGTLPDALAADALDWHTVCRVADLEVAWGEAALIDGEQVALIKVSASEVYAVAHRDPVTGAHVMARGIVGNKGWHRTLASPLHKEVYDLATGECFTDPALALRVYPVRLREGMVTVGLPADAAVGIAA
ncbi:assimilatory nitrite reductase (NAD(P)H) small subunit [Arthrobacter crystallopoietes]|uniref:Assimilatory nitrite reductase (NAD(P)H) small subunit n=2 Tax=Crystallibacter crystallopoietes TaxID=37928 RepID=A0A1H0ZD92_9MICC|nr:assimilatory nitrite reductase (NAD(P)H) small subunit [Arthrobacter crystallopoietes]